MPTTDQSKLEIIVTKADGTRHSESIEGPAAAAGLDTFQQWIDDQNAASSGDDPDRPLKYPNPAVALKVGIVNQILQLAERFPSKALEKELAALEKATAAVEAKRKALAALALGVPSN